MMKVVRDKHHVSYKSKPIRITDDLSEETQKAKTKKECTEIVQPRKKKNNCQVRDWDPISVFCR
jgi:hypothetical protein